MEKIALVTYNPELMCFGHVLLYALDFHEKGYEVKVVIEGGGGETGVDAERSRSPLLWTLSEN